MFLKILAISCDRILEIKMATAMFKVVNTPECYQKKEDMNGTNCSSCESQNTDAGLKSRINDIPTSTGTMKWRIRTSRSILYL
jgi:hypothetical protein